MMIAPIRILSVDLKAAEKCAWLFAGFMAGKLRHDIDLRASACCFGAALVMRCIISAVNGKEDDPEKTAVLLACISLAGLALSFMKF